jgi:cysteinyl-tRNA synthetase
VSLSLKLSSSYHRNEIPTYNFLLPYVRFVEGIISKGYAYESNGSVYFDTVSFGAKNFYAKLQPNNVVNLFAFVSFTVKQKQNLREMLNLPLKGKVP